MSKRATPCAKSTQILDAVAEELANGTPPESVALLLGVLALGILERAAEIHPARSPR